LDKAKDPEEDEMALLSTDSGGAGFEPVPAGTYVARCVSVVDLGVQATGFGDKEKVYIGWEVPSERVEWEKDGQKHQGPALIGSRYTNSIHPKSILGQHLTSWRGVPFTDEERSGFDLFTVLGAPCMISVTHTEKNGKTYANVNAVMRLPAGTVCPDAETEMIAYSPMDQTTQGNLDKLPPWLQTLVRTGYKMAEGSHTIGSAGGPMPGALPPTIKEDARAAALRTAGLPPTPPPGDDFDDDIPF
jgi:hypothetical protein